MLCFVCFFVFFVLQIKGKTLHQQKDYDFLCCGGVELNSQYLCTDTYLFFLHTLIKGFALIKSPSGIHLGESFA